MLSIESRLPVGLLTLYDHGEDASREFDWCLMNV